MKNAAHRADFVDVRLSIRVSQQMRFASRAQQHKHSIEMGASVAMIAATAEHIQGRFAWTSLADREVKANHLGPVASRDGRDTASPGGENLFEND
ncbi:MAG: hypothetical protein WCA28_07735 [Bradyrhizobium sp.]